MSNRTPYEDAPTEETVRRVRSLDLRSSTSLRTPPEHADPIFTPIFTSAFLALNFSAAASAFLASAATAIATTAVTPGIDIMRRA